MTDIERAAIRASDADRERVVAILREECAAGRLTLTELEERLEETYAARMLADLDRPLRELPVLARRAAAAPVGPAGPVGASPVAAASTPMLHADHDEGKGFMAHFTSYVIINAFLIGIWAMTGGGYFWPAWPLMGWGIGIAFHAVGALQHRSGRTASPR
jgi:hypothetical protein